MELDQLFKDKSIKPKEKTELLAQEILQNKTFCMDVLNFALLAKASDKATCIEAFEFATKTDKTIARQELWDFVVSSLNEKEPRVKWEAAKVIGNIAALFPNQLEGAISALLTNSEHSGTVVRWSAAYALGEILKLKSKHNKELTPAIESIIIREEKNSIKKIYQAAIKKL